MTIRKANRNDLEKIAFVAKSTWNATYKDIFSQQFIDKFLENAYSLDRLSMRLDKSLIYVVEVLEEVVGFLNFSQGVDGTFELVALYILPNYQGKGYGRALLEQFIQEHENLKEIILHVEQQNNNAQKFYLSNGFIEVERFEEFFLGETLQTIKMSRIV